MGRRAKNLVGQGFGEWTATGRAGSNTSGATWHVRCSCGTERIVGSKELTSGHSTSCGCLRKRKRSLLGKRFGRLVIIMNKRKDQNRNNLWLCRCDCGRETVVISNSLLRGSTRSCGCLQKEKASQANNKRPKLSKSKQGGLIYVTTS
jgi:hypothetical protein